MTDDSTFTWSSVTEETHRILECAKVEARRAGQDEVRSEHLLLAILKVNKGVAAEVLRELGLTLASTIDHVESLASKREVTHSAFSALQLILLQALIEALGTDNRTVTSGHLLLALSSENTSPMSDLVDRLELESAVVRSCVMEAMKRVPEYRAPALVPADRAAVTRKVAELRRLQTFIEELKEPWAEYFSPLLSSLRETVMDAAQVTIGDLVRPADDKNPTENRANAYAGFCDTLDVAIAEAWQLLREKGLDPGDGSLA
ncbi:MAG: Clp protease N-terminal domain-containing protein [Acidimicrobiia bacterium]